MNSDLIPTSGFEFNFWFGTTSGWNPLPIGAHNWFLGPLPEVGPNQKSGSKKNTQKCNKTSSCNIIIITPDIVHRYLFLKEIKLFLTFLFRDLLTVYHCYVSKWVCLLFSFNLPTYLHFWCDFIIYYFSKKVNAPQILTQQCLEHATQKQSVQVKGELSMEIVQLDLECAVLLCKSLNFKFFLTYWQSTRYFVYIFEFHYL